MKERYLKFKKQLEWIRDEILKKIKGLQKNPDFGDAPGSPDEESSETEEFGTQMAISQKYKEQLADVDVALNKMGKDRYAICERCGKEISENVLKIAPESKLCQNCKTKIKNKKITTKKSPAKTVKIMKTKSVKKRK